VRTNLVIETYFDRDEQNFYYLMVPDVSEAHFYRSVRSLNAFFHSVRSPRANVTEVRQFTCDDEGDCALRKKSKMYADVEWETLRTFPTIWAFYEFIGYDHKARRYASGERMKAWDGDHEVVPKRRRV
jgi:hypothetical protein